MEIEELKNKLLKKITEEEIKKLQFLSGIEIHQQLEGKKLFSNKKTIIVDEKEKKPDLIAVRRMHITKSEINKTDKAAEDEIKKNKIIEYYIYKNSDSLIEIDEEPPQNVNKKALNTTLQFIQLTNAKTVDYIIPMRKIVVDGSNTSGFQRTMLIAKNGTLHYKIKNEKKTITLDTITLEEDSAKKIEEIKDEKGRIVTKYNLSRLGVPLIEIATTPCFKTPKELKEGALKIGRTLRLLEVKRGIGTIRQDVNISIKEGARVEIKGAQNIKEIEELAENEIIRQKNLLLIQEYIKKNKIKTKEEKIIELNNILKNSNSKIIKKAIEENKKILGVKIKNYNGLLGLKINPNKTLGKEIAEYIKTHTGVKGLFHKDELPNYGITLEEKNKIEKKLEVKKQDNFIIIVEEEKTAKKAIKKAIERIKTLEEKIPSEVRKANEDNTTSYLREMPGENRMYPETDLEIINLKEYIKNNKIEKPLTEEETKQKYKKLGLNEEFIKIIMNSYEKKEYDSIIKNYVGKEKLIAKIIFQYKKEVEKKLKEKINTKKIVKTIIENDIDENKIVEFLTKEYEKIKNNSIDKKTTEQYKTKKLDEKTKTKIKSIIKKELEKNTPIGKIIHLLITQHNIDGKTANQIIQEVKKEE